MSNLNAKEYKTFGGIKHITTDGVEFLFARELSSILQYNKWENFAKVIDRAMIACRINCNLTNLWDKPYFYLFITSISNSL